MCAAMPEVAQWKAAFPAIGVGSLDRFARGGVCVTDTTFDVRIWELRVKNGRPRKNGKPGKKSYVVRWVVAGQEFTKTHATSALAESIRSKLIIA
jgi:hypothetical protein